MKYIIKKVLFISLLLSSLAAHAEPDVDSFIQFKISSLQLFSSFSSFIYFQGDDRNRTRLLNAKNQGDQAIALLPDSEVELKLKWQEISDFVESYQSYRFDGADMSLEAGWSIYRKELNAIIDARAASEVSGITDVQVKMETILSQYMGYANATTGGYGVSYDNVPLEQQINILKKQLAELAQADARYQPLLKKWSYIEGALLAYNSNVAPFVVLYTFDSMRKMIASE